MRIVILAVVLLGLLAETAYAQDASCPAGKVCVDKADMPTFLEALKEKQCLLKTPPTVTSDPLTIVIDRDGRVYGSGSDPHPYTVHLSWCNYTLDAKGETKIVAAMASEPSYGFRFRPKAALGLLGTELVSGAKFADSWDGGILLEPFFFQWANINAYVGFRSVGAGLGFDITKNFGAYLGYAVTWGGWRSNPLASLYFSFW
jgi:hypothetical protein